MVAISIQLNAPVLRAPSPTNTATRKGADSASKAATPLPVFLDNLVNREWRTRTVAKAASGKVAFRGFRGRYRLEWTDATGAARSKWVELE